MSENNDTGIQSRERKSLSEMTIRLGPAVAVVVVLIGQAVIFERRITTLTETAVSSDRRLETIEGSQGGVKDELVNVRLAIEKLDGRQAGESRLLHAEMKRLEQRIEALESVAGSGQIGMMKNTVSELLRRVDKLEGR